MQANDAQRLEALLAEVSACFGMAKPAPTAALKHWFDALRAFPFHKVETSLNTWIATKSKFPTIADIAVPLNEEAADQRDRQYQQEKQADKIASETWAATELGEKISTQLVEFLGKRERTDPKKWARDILTAWASDEPLYYTHIIDGTRHELNHGKKMSDIQIRFACEALGISYKRLITYGPSGYSVRQPGEEG